jgi:hypothetical protein
VTSTPPIGWIRRRLTANSQKSALAFEPGTLLRRFFEQALDEAIHGRDGAAARAHDELNRQGRHFGGFEQRALEGMQVQLDELRAQLLAERNNADKAVGGEGQLKTEYAALMEQERQILAQARQGSTAV